MWWCLCYSDYNRQRDHVCYHAPLEDIPEVDFILASKVTVRPAPGTLKSEAELDAECLRGSDMDEHGTDPTDSENGTDDDSENGRVVGSDAYGTDPTVTSSSDSDCSTSE